MLPAKNCLILFTLSRTCCSLLCCVLLTDFWASFRDSPLMLLLESPLDLVLLSLVHIFSFLSSSTCYSELLALTHLTIIPTKLGVPWKSIKWSTSLTQVSYKPRPGLYFLSLLKRSLTLYAWLTSVSKRFPCLCFLRARIKDRWHLTQPNLISYCIITVWQWTAFFTFLCLVPISVKQEYKLDLSLLKYILGISQTIP